MKPVAKVGDIVYIGVDAPYSKARIKNVEEGKTRDGASCFIYTVDIISTNDIYTRLEKNFPYHYPCTNFSGVWKLLPVKTALDYILENL